MSEPINDLWLILIGPALIAGAYAFAFLYDHFFGDCRHDFDNWQPWSTDHAYVQQRQCKKCGYIQTEQFKKITP